MSFFSRQRPRQAILPPFSQQQQQQQQQQPQPQQFIHVLCQGSNKIQYQIFEECLMGTIQGLSSPTVKWFSVEKNNNTFVRVS